MLQGRPMTCLALDVDQFRRAYYVDPSSHLVGKSGDVTLETGWIEVVARPLESLDSMGMPAALPNPKGGLMAVFAGTDTGEHGRNGYRRASLCLLLEIVGRFEMGLPG